MCENINLTFVSPKRFFALGIVFLPVNFLWFLYALIEIDQHVNFPVIVAICRVTQALASYNNVYHEP